MRGRRDAACAANEPGRFFRSGFFVAAFGGSRRGHLLERGGERTLQRAVEIGPREADAGAVPGQVERPREHVRRQRARGFRRDQSDPHARRDEREHRREFAELLGNLERRARAAQREQHVVVKAGRVAAREHEHRLAAQRGRRDRVVHRERVIERQRDDEAFFQDHARVDARIRGRQPDHPEIDPPVAQCGDLVGRRHVLQVERDQRITLAHRAQHGRQQRGQHRRHERDPQRADFAAARQPRHLLRARGLLQRGACFGQEHAPGVAQFDLVPVALEQARAECFLECLDLHAQRGLHDAQAPRGAPEMQLFRERDEGAQLLEFHGRRAPVGGNQIS
uniref:Uncharacterized protein n=1 Tax=Burkholderia cenocepacia TaxID=95486 RepID=A0A071MJJ3_9BURK